MILVFAEMAHKAGFDWDSSTQTSIRSLNHSSDPLIVFQLFCTAGVAEYKAFLIATSRGSPVSDTPLRLGTYA